MRMVGSSASAQGQRLLYDDFFLTSYWSRSMPTLRFSHARFPGFNAGQRETYALSPAFRRCRSGNTPGNFIPNARARVESTAPPDRHGISCGLHANEAGVYSVSLSEP